MNKYFAFVLFLLLLMSSVTFAQRKIIAKSFVQSDEITAQVTSRKDVNNQNCALIKIQTDIKEGLRFDTYYGICGDDIPYDAGEYRLYVSPGERRITIKCEGYMPLYYDVPINVESLKTYILQITGSGAIEQPEGDDLNFLIITTTPDNADVAIEVNGKRYDGFTPFQKMVQVGTCFYKITKQNYEEVNGTVDVTADQKGEVNITLQPTFGNFKIITSPSEADIKINNAATGKSSPADFTFQQPGTYTVEASKDFYKTQSQTFTIAKGDDKTINITLPPDFAKLTVSGTPSGADILLDNIAINQKTPYTQDRIRTGSHTIRITKADYKTYEQTFIVEGGKDVVINYDLNADFAKLTVSGTPSGADILLDNIAINQKTPYTQDRIRTGSHTIRITKADYRPYEQTFTVEAGKDVAVNYNLDARFAQITINVNQNADIYINNQKRANGTFKDNLPEGMQIIEVKKDKYYPQKQTIEVIAGQAQTYSFELKPIIGKIAVSTTPLDCDVYLDGVNKGKSPMIIKDIIIGDHNLEVRKQGYATVTAIINVTENQTIEKDLTLQSGMQVTINSNPQGANVYIDGNLIGKAPQTLSLNFGSHKVKLTGIDKYKDTEQNIEIIQGGQTNFTLDLNSEVLIPETVFIKGGTFQMGSNDGEDNEKPIHSVTVSDFYMGKYEVTNEQFCAFLNDYGTDKVKSGEYSGQTMIVASSGSYDWGVHQSGGKWYPASGYAKSPVINVTWYGANEYCNWLSQKTGKTYRLLTEAEWEYAAKGGQSYTYAGSNTIGEVAWYYDNSGSTTHTVGTKSPNAFGLYDMSGNVWEWGNDWYSSVYYSFSPSTNPIGTSSGSLRVIRGGSWNTNAGYCRVAFRYFSNPFNYYYNLGFRVVCTSAGR